MKNKKRMLVIPGPFVPYNDTLTLLNYKRLSYLDLSFDVIALGGMEDKSISEELANDSNFNKFKVKRILDYKKMDIVHHPMDIFYFIYAFFKYKKEALRLVKSNNYDYLYTASHPGMVHLIGKIIKKRKPNIKWIASFSDPIKGSPFKLNPEIKKRSIFYQLAFKIGTFFYVGDFYEEAAINNADKLVFICDEQRDFTCSQYNNKNDLVNKSIIVPLSIEHNWKMYKNLIDNKNNKNPLLVASHLGRIYGLRKIDNFLLALKELKEEGLISKDKIKFYQYDEIENRYKLLINKYKIDDIFICKERVSYDDSIQSMKNSDILLLFDTLMPDSKIQPYLPSKIVEYLAMKKPVVGVCDSNSPSYRILKEYGYSTIGSSVEEIKNSITNVMNNSSKKIYELDNLFSENACKSLKDEIENAL